MVKNSPAIPELKDTSEKNGLPNAFYNLSLKKNKIALSKMLITLSTKVRLVKAMVFPVVMYGCEIWTIKKAEH